MSLPCVTRGVRFKFIVTKGLFFMSFSSDIKEKLCKARYECAACALWETAGALLFGGSATDKSVRFSTENRIVAQRVKDDLSASFGFDFEIKAGTKTYRIETDDVYACENICGGILLDGGIPFSCCRESFARGAFLGGGSATDPVKGYHLEFDTKNRDAAVFLRDMLSGDDFSPKLTERKGYNIVYIKDSSRIADLLGYIGAPQSALELFTVQVEREMRNNVNRRVNCENANTNKAAKASSKHLYAIKKLMNNGKWDKLSDTLKEIARLRVQYPEDSLKELGEKTDPPIGKSGVNHRLNRILDFANDL